MDDINFRLNQERQQKAESWLNQLKEEFPYRDKAGKIIPLILELYHTAFTLLTEERNKFRETSDEFLSRDAALDLFAKFLDALDVELGRKHPDPDEDAALAFAENIDAMIYAREFLERGQTTAMEAGLLGVNLGEDYKQALNKMWFIVHQFVVKKK